MMTIVTTIGYGTFAPSLPFGRSMVILFGSVTIVLFGLVSRPAVDLVEAIEARTELLLLRARRSEQPLSEQGQKMLKGASAMLLCHAVLMTAAVIVYLDRDAEDPLHEEWDYGTCYYFCFVTFSSIGLGDFSLGPADNSNYELGRLLVQALIIMFGMAAFNVATGACSDLVLPLGATFSSQLRAWAVQLGSRVATSCARSRDGKKVELLPSTQDPMAVPSTSWIVSGSARRPRTPSTAYASACDGSKSLASIDISSLFSSELLQRTTASAEDSEHTEALHDKAEAPPTTSTTPTPPASPPTSRAMDPEPPPQPGPELPPQPGPAPSSETTITQWSDEMLLDPALMSDEQIAEEMARIRRTHLRNAAEAHADGGSALTAEGGNRLIDGLTTDEVEDSFFDVHVSPDVEEEHRAAARVQSFARGRSGRRALKDRQQAAARREAELAAQFASAAPLQLDRREEIAALHSEIEKLRDGRVALVGQLIVARAVMDVMMDAATAELLLDLEEGSEGIRFRISIDAPVSPGPRLISRVHARIARVRAAMTRAAMAALSDRTVMESAPQQLALPSRVRDAIALIEGRAACLDGPVDGARRRHVHHEHVVLAAAVERR